MCVLCRLIVYFMGGKLVFDWDRREDFFITRDEPVGNKVTNTISYVKVEYHVCKYSAPRCGGQKMVPHVNKWSPLDGAHE